MKNTITINSGAIRKHNTFLRNCAVSTKSDILYDLYLENIIRTKTGRAVVKG